MKSSERKGESYLSNSAGYSLLTMYMPLTMLLAYILLIEALLNVNLPSTILLMYSLVSALAATLYCDFMKDVKSGRIAANVRGAIIIVAVLYIASSLFPGGIYRGDLFQPNYTNVMVSIGVLYTWISVISFKQLFIARHRFEITTESYKGEQLQEKLYEEIAMQRYTYETINKKWRNYFYQLVVVGVLAITGVIFDIKLPITLYILLAVILVGGVCIQGLFKIIKWEHYYANEGISFSAGNRTKRLLALIALTLLGFIAAFFLASDKSFLDFSVIIGFLIWFFSLLKRSSTIRSESTDSYERIPEMDIPSGMVPYSELAPSPIGELIAKYAVLLFKYGIIILAVFLFIRFMISPLLNRGDVSDKLPFHRRFIRIIAEWFKSLLAVITSFFANIKSDKTNFKLRRKNKDEILRTAENIFNAYSPAKKSDMKQSVTLFAQLINWGNEARDVRWKPSLAPGEYCDILATAPPVSAPDNSEFPLEKLNTQNEGIIRCGEIFEKAIYSAEVLSDNERDEFKNLVEEITSD
jgi:hypothetical protein